MLQVEAGGVGVVQEHAVEGASFTAPSRGRPAHEQQRHGLVEGIRSLVIGVAVRVPHAPGAVAPLQPPRLFSQAVRPFAGDPGLGQADAGQLVGVAAVFHVVEERPAFMVAKHEADRVGADFDLDAGGAHRDAAPALLYRASESGPGSEPPARGARKGFGPHGQTHPGHARVGEVDPQGLVSAVHHHVVLVSTHVPHGPEGLPGPGGFFLFGHGDGFRCFGRFRET